MEFEGLALVGYIAACLVVPAIWGVIAAWLFRKADNKRSRGPDVDYII